MIRSPIDAYKWELVDRLRILAELTGASLVVQDSYAGWPFRKDSPLQQLCCQVYNRLTGQELKIEKLNSCAETGEIAGAIPDMDIVALAPWGRGAHTPREHLDLDTLQPFWEFFDSAAACHVRRSLTAKSALFLYNITKAEVLNCTSAFVAFITIPNSV